MQVLDEVFQFSDPPMYNAIRIPSLLVARIRHLLSPLLVQKDEYGIPVFFWYHRDVFDAIVNTYLQPEDQPPTELFYLCNRNLAELFGADDKVTSFEKNQFRKNSSLISLRVDEIMPV